MTGLDREDALDRVEELVDTVENDRMPVPVREVWVYGDVALGLDPVDRLDVYLTKDILMDGDPDREDEFVESHGVQGVGKTVRADWAGEHPEHLRANPNGHAAPEKCLAAHLIDDEPIHLEVCNASFEDNVTQRLRGAVDREAYEEILDPRGACLWVDGTRSDDAFEKLRNSELPFPTLSESLEMLGLEPEQAETAAAEIHAWREQQEGATVRGDVV
ncbi:hypothetical protein BRD03_11915 [Halobacteriales archaeon QS_9_68_17]|nr:MAG: hypothetical protein BRD03_11915 [Halobacteriales archaeon QS_9_68_17]